MSGQLGHESTKKQKMSLAAGVSPSSRAVVGKDCMKLIVWRPENLN
jgi:hypothetical protein